MAMVHPIVRQVSGLDHQYGSVTYSIHFRKTANFRIPVVNPLAKSSVQLPKSPSSGAQTLPKSLSSGVHILPKSPSRVLIQTPPAKQEILQPHAQIIPPKQHMTQVTQEI